MAEFRNVQFGQFLFVADTLADADVALPGGPGTLDEVSDVISLARLKVDDKPVILMNINGYYEPLREVLNAMVNAEFIAAEEIDGVHFLPTVEEAGKLLGRTAGGDK